MFLYIVGHNTETVEASGPLKNVEFDNLLAYLLLVGRHIDLRYNDLEEEHTEGLYKRYYIGQNNPVAATLLSGLD